jgi:tRNA nucleotidyltransferase/poly(A) polymerase
MKITSRLSALEMEFHDLSKSHEVFHKQLEQARDEESSLRAKVETLEPCAAEVQMLRVIQAEAACIPDLRSQLHALLSAKSTLEARVQELQVEQTEMARLRAVEGSFVAFTESTAELRRKIEVLTASHIAAKEECARETALKDAAESRLVSTIENFECSIDALKEK